LAKPVLFEYLYSLSLSWRSGCHLLHVVSDRWDHTPCVVTSSREHSFINPIWAILHHERRRQYCHVASWPIRYLVLNAAVASHGVTVVHASTSHHSSDDTLHSSSDPKIVVFWRNEGLLLPTPPPYVLPAPP